MSEPRTMTSKEVASLTIDILEQLIADIRDGKLSHLEFDKRVFPQQPIEGTDRYQFVKDDMESVTVSYHRIG